MSQQRKHAVLLAAVLALVLPIIYGSWAALHQLDEYNRQEMEKLAAAVNELSAATSSKLMGSWHSVGSPQRTLEFVSDSVMIRNGQRKRIELTSTILMVEPSSETPEMYMVSLPDQETLLLISTPTSLGEALNRPFQNQQKYRRATPAATAPSS